MRHFMFICGLVAVLGAGQFGYGQDTQATAPSAATMPAKTTVTVLERGDEPRQALRYDFQVGSKETMVMQMDAQISLDVNDRHSNVDMPPMRIIAEVRAEKLTEQGDLQQSFEFTDAKVLDRPSDSKQLVESVRSQLENLKGLKGSGVLTPRGELLKAEFELPKEASPQLRKQLQRVKQTMSQMSVLLPQEPVGEGARWQVKTPIKSGQMEVLQTVTYTLRELKKDSVTLDMTFKQEAPEQVIGEVNGQPLKLLSLKSEGTGETQVTFDRMVPKSKMDLTADIVQQVRDQKMHMQMKTSVEIHEAEEDAAP